MPNNLKVWHICKCSKSCIAKHPYDANDNWCLWCSSKLTPIPSDALRLLNGEKYRERLVIYADELARAWGDAA